MAKRELSGTLKNLKFMRRGTKREEKIEKVEEVIPDGNFSSSSTPKKCVVITEGDPHPGATRGRMSFQSFNPSVDKLNEETDSVQRPEGSSTSSGNQDRGNRENGSAQNGSESSKLDRNNGDANGDLKRKQAEVISEIPYPNKSPKTDKGNQDSTTSSRSSHKKHKREKLDWNVLRPLKSQNKRG